MLQFDSKFTVALLAVALGSLCLLLLVLGGRRRPGPAIAEGEGQSTGDATNAAQGRRRKIAKGAVVRDEALRRGLEFSDDIKEPTILVAVEVLMQSDGAVAPAASRAVRRLAGLGGRVILCGGARSDDDEAAVRAMLRDAGVFGDEAVESHFRLADMKRLVFYSSDVGRRAIARQLEPHVLMCPDAWVTDFEDVTSRVPCVIAVREAAPSAGEGDSPGGAPIKHRIAPSRLLCRVSSLDEFFAPFTVTNK